MPKISAVIITFNEEKYIERCITSLEGIADEIVVVDSYSTDKTEEICGKLAVKFSKHKFEGYVEQKNYALSLAAFPWVLSLDADEALGDESRKSILEIKENLKYDGYIFNRLNNYCGKWIRHSRWYPDKHLRLFNPAKGTWTGPNPHDKFILSSGSKAKRLKGDILHLNYESIEEHVDKINRFSTISANEYFRAGRKAGPLTAHLHMGWCFFRSYILNAGFLDGYFGYMGCMITAMGSYLKYAKLRKLIIRAKQAKDNYGF
jgi:glycosyltransferase involved in cell wall biosynthesis